MDKEGSPISDDWVALNMVEGGKLIEIMTSVHAIEKQWQRYRNNPRPSKMRGKSFFRVTAVHEILGGIIGSVLR